MFEPVPAGEGQRAAETPTYLEAPFSDCFYVSCSLDHEALSDLRVRQAVHHAIDKEKLVRQLAGLGEPATGGLSPRSRRTGRRPTSRPIRTTPSARRRYCRSGLRRRLHRRALRVPGSADWHHRPGGPGGPLHAVGITVDAKIQPSEVWLEKVLTNPPGMVVSRWELPYPHGSYVVDGACDSAAIEAGCCNFSNLRSDEVDALAAKPEPRLTRSASRALQADRPHHRGRAGALDPASLIRSSQPSHRTAFAGSRFPARRRASRSSSPGTGSMKAELPSAEDVIGSVMTVLGPLEPRSLGATLVHEHLFIDLRRMRRSCRRRDGLGQLAEAQRRAARPRRPRSGNSCSVRDNLVLDDLGARGAELERFAAAGGGASSTSRRRTSVARPRCFAAGVEQTRRRRRHGLRPLLRDRATPRRLASAREDRARGRDRAASSPKASAATGSGRASSARSVSTARSVAPAACSAR